MLVSSIRQIYWLGVAVSLTANSLLAQDVEKKAEVPNDAALAEPMKLLKEVYGEELAAAKTTVQRKALAKKLLVEAEGTKDDLASKYALLKASKSVAVQALDGEMALETIDKIADSFAVDVLELKTDALKSIQQKARQTADHVSINGLALGLIDQAIADDAFDPAEQLGNIALDEARKAHSSKLLRQAQSRLADIQHKAEAYGENKTALATLEKQPADGPANLVVGKYQCFVKGDWEKGIPMLALGNDVGLKTLATADLKGAVSSAEQLKLGEAWWSLAEKEDSIAKKALQVRARYWYRQSLPALTGLVKQKVSLRLEAVKDLDEPPPPSTKSKWVLIFKSSDPTVWNTDSPDKNRFAIPLSKAPEKIRFLKIQMDPKEYVVIAMTKEKLATEFDGDKVGWQGTNCFAWGGHELGVYDRTYNAHTNGSIAIRYFNGSEFSGWGFGYCNYQGYAWNRKPIKPTVFEIYVTSLNLTSSEKKQLLK